DLARLDALAVADDAGRPLAVADDPLHEGPGPDGQVAAPAHPVEVRAGGAEPTAAVQVAVEGREALLAVAVHVVGERVPGLLHGLEERLEQRPLRRPALQLERALPAAEVAVRVGQAALHLLEVRQAVRVVPAL